MPNSSDETDTTPFAGLVVDLAPNYSLYGSYGEIFNPQSELDVNHQFVGALLRQYGHLVDRDFTHAAAAFFGGAIASVVYKDAAHYPGSNGEEVCAALEARPSLVDEPKVSFVNQGGGLKRVVWPLPT